MKRNELYAAWKNSMTQPIYLFHGEEEYIKQSALETLRKMLLPEGLELLNETRFDGGASAESIMAACETLPVFCEKRLVVVRDWAPLLSQKGGSEAKAGKDDGLDAFLLFLADPPPGCVLVFTVTGKVSGVKRAAKALKPFEVLFERLDDNEMYTWLAQRSKQFGARISAATCDALVFAAGRDLVRLSGEVGKLCAYAQGRDITPEDVKAVVTPTPESKVFDMIDALIAGKLAAAQTLLQAVLAAGEDEVMVLSLITRQVRQLCHCKGLLLRKKSQQEIASALSISPFFVRKLSEQARRLSYDSLLATCKKCIEAEYATKSGRWSKEGALARTMLLLRSGLK